MHFVLGITMSSIGRLLFNDGNSNTNSNYRTWRIEAEGYDWLIIRRSGDFNYLPELITFNDSDSLHRQEIIDKWAIPPSTNLI